MSAPSPTSFPSSTAASPARRHPGGTNSRCEWFPPVRLPASTPPPTRTRGNQLAHSTRRRGPRTGVVHSRTGGTNSRTGGTNSRARCVRAAPRTRSGSFSTGSPHPGAPGPGEPTRTGRGEPTRTGGDRSRPTGGNNSRKPGETTRADGTIVPANAELFRSSTGIGIEELRSEEVAARPDGDRRAATSV